jgi:multidrug efflux pump subunit AcrB
MNIASFSIKNPVLVNIIMMSTIVLGAYSLAKLPREMNPDVSFPWVFILTPAPGFSPEDSEKLLTDKIEKEVRNIEGLDNITSISREDASFVWLRFETMPEDEFDKRKQDVRDAVERVDLPETVESPNVVDFSIQDHLPMVNLVLSSDFDQSAMKAIAEDLKDDILELRHIAKCEIFGIRDREIWVEVDPGRLQSYDMSLNHVMDAIRMSNLDLSAGDIKVGRWEYIVRTVGELGTAKEIERVILKANPLGNHVRVGDVADVQDTFAEETVLSRFNGLSAILFTITKKKEGNSIALIEEIRNLAGEYERDRLPEGAKLTITNDSSVQIDEFLGILQNNALLGLVLVVVSLYVFLGPRNALFAAIGIPVTFLTTMVVMDYSDINLSGSSLFGLVLVLGMIVDDAIVIIENCYRHIQAGYNPREAALLGTKQVAMPVLSSSLTTIAAFLPLMLMEGVMGEFLKVVPIVVTIALLASLFEAFFILPSHIADWSRITPKSREGFIRFGKMRKLYVRYLAKFLRRRGLVVFITTTLLFASLPLIAVVGVDMFASEEIPRFYVFMDMPEGTKLEITDDIVKEAEKIVSKLPGNEVLGITGYAGLQQRDDEWLFKPSVGELLIELTHRRDRERTTDEIIASLREEISHVAGIKTLEFKKFVNGPPAGSAVEVRVRGEYLGELQTVVRLVKDELNKMAGVYDVRDDFVPGKRELRVTVDEERAAALGLTKARIATTIHYAFEGGAATEIRDGKEEVDVIVKYRPESRQSLVDLENMKVVSATGQMVTLKDVAHFSTKQGYASIKHDELRRSIGIKADVDEEINSAVTVNNELKKRFTEIARRYPGYDLTFRGQFEEFTDSFNQLGQLFAVGLMIMYVILAGQFKSFIQPLIIFMAIVFAFLGAIIGMLVINSPFNINNMYGLVALAGVAVNDSLVFISFINDARENGVTRWRSILLAGKLRLRPILLTTITTVFGLIPMAIGMGGKSDIWSPLANLMAWGLTIGTILTLFIVPCLYAIIGDVKRLVLGRRFIDSHGRIVARIKDRLDVLNGGNGRTANEPSKVKS